jgi:hypothetical protein
MRAAAHILSVDDDLAHSAVSSLRKGGLAAVVFSGKLASGKDSVAAEVSRTMEELGYARAIVFSTSKPIRGELDQVIGLIGASDAPGEAIGALMGEMALSYEVSDHMVSVLFDMTRDGCPKADDRTDLNRHLLQYLADVGRRLRDPDYWVKRSFPLMLEAAANGQSAFLSGGRYPNEIGPAENLGMLTARLVVSRKVQEDRLRARDGLAPDPELLDNPNECALDGYVGFNFVVGNDDEMTPTVEVITAEVDSHAQRLTR